MKARKQLALLAILVAVWAIATGFAAAQESKPANPAGAQSANAAKAPDKLDSLPASEFARLVREFSEESGYFRSDNFTSNETAYLTVVDTLRRLGASGGAYLGVGPEQNCTYIAKIRPRIAFMVDIPRHAIIQRPKYLDVFGVSADRDQITLRLLSRPRPQDKTPVADATMQQLLVFFCQAVPDEKT